MTIMNPEPEPSRNGAIELKRAGILSLRYDPETEEYLVGQDGHKPNIRCEPGEFADLAFCELATIEKNTTLSVGFVQFPFDSKAVEIARRQKGIEIGSNDDA